MSVQTPACDAQLQVAFLNKTASGGWEHANLSQCPAGTYFVDIDNGEHTIQATVRHDANFGKEVKFGSVYAQTYGL